MVGRVKAKLRRDIFKNAPEEFIACVVEVVLNSLKNPNCNLSPSCVKKMETYKNIIRGIAYSKETYVKKRKVLQTQKGGFIAGFLINQFISHVLPQLLNHNGTDDTKDVSGNPSSV